MGEIRTPPRVMLILAAISNEPAALDWARHWAISSFGQIARESERFAFVETSYYSGTMGEDLSKTFLAFGDLISPDTLRAVKCMTNEAEALYARQSNSEHQRPLNLDPGYLNESKLVLASTKDHAHRLYLGDGIFAEVTLRFRDRHWQPWDWTYPDYRRKDYQEFFTECRKFLRAQVRQR
jgi:hypothetical protein